MFALLESKNPSNDGFASTEVNAPYRSFCSFRVSKYPDRRVSELDFNIRDTKIVEKFGRVFVQQESGMEKARKQFRRMHVLQKERERDRDSSN